jgi:hypothetical protein
MIPEHVGIDLAGRDLAARGSEVLDLQSLARDPGALHPAEHLRWCVALLFHAISRLNSQAGRCAHRPFSTGDAAIVALGGRRRR